MKINSANLNRAKSPQAFTSRNAEIRFADDIMRAVNRNFPRFSTSKMSDLCQARGVKRTQKLIDKIIKLQLFRRNSPMDAINFTEAVVDYVKKHRVGNCGESCILTKMALDLNGVKNARFFDLKKFKNTLQDVNVTALDHSVIVVNMAKDADLKDFKTFGKKAYVVDPWLGFVDYAPVAFKKYADNNTNILNLENGNETLGVAFATAFPTRSIKIIEKIVPELKMRKKVEIV